MVKEGPRKGLGRKSALSAARSGARATDKAKSKLKQLEQNAREERSTAKAIGKGVRASADAARAIRGQRGAGRSGGEPAAEHKPSVISQERGESRNARRKRRGQRHQPSQAPVNKQVIQQIVNVEASGDQTSNSCC